MTSKYRKLSSCGAAEMPGAGSCTRRSVSCCIGQKLERDVQIRFGDVSTDLDDPLRDDEYISIRLVQMVVWLFVYLWKSHENGQANEREAK